MTYSSKNSLISLGLRRIRSATSLEFPLDFSSSSTTPWACSIQRSQIWALIPAISRLVSGFLRPHNEHSRISLAISYFLGRGLLSAKHLVNHSVGFGFIRFHPIITLAVGINLYIGLSRMLRDDFVKFFFQFQHLTQVDLHVAGNALGAS